MSRASYSCGGCKAWLFGDCPAHGDGDVHSFTHGTVDTSRELDPSHGFMSPRFPTQS